MKSHICCTCVLLIACALWIAFAFDYTTCTVHSMTNPKYMIAKYTVDSHTYYSRMSKIQGMSTGDTFGCYVFSAIPTYVSKIFPPSIFIVICAAIILSINLMVQCYKGIQGDCLNTIDVVRSKRHVTIPDCVMCEDRKQSCRYNCGHNIACRKCTKRLKKCPICSTPITSVKMGVYEQSEYSRPIDV